MRHMHVGASWGQKGLTNAMELDLSAVASHHVGAGN